MLSDAELDAMQKSGWSVSASTQLQRLIAAYRELRKELTDLKARVANGAE